MCNEKYWSDFFDKKAGSGEEEAKRLTFSSEVSRQSVYEAIQFFIHGHFHNVLDAGAGMGELSVRIMGQASLVVALDVSYEMLRWMRDNILPVQDQITLCQGTVRKPPFSEACFDLIVASEVLQYVPFSPSFNRLVALLKPKGILVASIPNKADPAIMRAHERRDRMYNGIGIEELGDLSKVKGITCKFMPLYLADDGEKRYVQGEIYEVPVKDSFQKANRFIIKAEKKS